MKFSPKGRLAGFALNCALFLCALALSLCCAEWILLAYERARFSTAYVDEHGLVNLRALNYNDTTLPAAKPPEEWRILSLGDSFAYSIMVSDYSYSGVAARLVNAVTTKPAVRIVNLGEPATSVSDYRAAYQYWSAILHPDAAIFNVFLGNDLLDIAFKYTPPRWTPNQVFSDKDFNIADGSSRSHIPHKFPLRLFDYAYAYALNFRPTPPAFPPPLIPDPRYNIAADNNFIHFTEETYFTITNGQLVNFDFSRVDELLAGYVAVYDFMRFAAGLLHDGQKVLITLAPSETQVDPALRSQLVERYHADLDRYDWTLPARLIQAIGTQVDPSIPVIDLTAYFQCRQEAGEKLYYDRNTHWNLAGNALAGQVIALYLLHNWFGAPVTLPQDQQACVAEKEKTGAKTSVAAIHAFLADRILPAIRASAAEKIGQAKTN